MSSTLSRIKAGQRGEFEFSGQGHQVAISKVYPEVRDGKFEVDMYFEQAPPAGIRRGQTVQVRLALGDTAEATLLPRGAFYQKTGGRWVYVVDKSGSAAVRARSDARAAKPHDDRGRCRIGTGGQGRHLEL